MDGLWVGGDVHYVMEDGEIRGAKVLRVWSTGTGLVNLAVFVDFDNDKSATSPIWKQQVLFDENREPNTWHWPPKS